MAVELTKGDAPESVVVWALFRNHGLPWPVETEQECYIRLGYVKGGTSVGT